MTGETLGNPEIVFERFTKYVEEHAADVPMREGIESPHSQYMYKSSAWDFNDSAQLVPISHVEFKASSTERETCHSISLKNNRFTIFHIEVVDNTSVYAYINEEEIKLEANDLHSILDKLTVHEIAGELVAPIDT